jgi:DNA-directed RNA polymerase specialized sigma24 family protein
VAGMPLEPDAFERLLGLLDASDRERAGERYEELRVALIRFFRWRGCNGAEDLADEALTRAAEWKREGEPVRDAHRFVYGIARLLALESHRRSAREEQAARELAVLRFPSRAEDDPREACLDACLAVLPAADRELIVAYYSGSQGEKIASRRRLADSHAISLVTLRVRAHRLRERLEGCLRRCLSGDR